VLTDVAVQKAHQDALDIVDRYCADYAVELGFTLTLETETDIDTFCQQLDDAVVSGVYGPVLVAGAARSVSGDDGDCINATADTVTRLLRVAFRSRRRALDRIAGANLPPSKKLGVLAQSATHIERARVALERMLQQRCPDDRFVALYGQSASAFLTLVAQRGDCLGGAAYVQDAVLCPPAVCGNAMIEPGEQCDDGNTLSGDGCDGTCKREGTQ
jgi:cysteine-rich repeat protein